MIYPLLACDFSSDILLLILVPDVNLVSFIFALSSALCLAWWPCCLIDLSPVSTQVTFASVSGCNKPGFLPSPPQLLL